MYSSAQEKALAELMSKTFYSRCLYTGLRYRTAGGCDEPCDLFWHSDGIVLLFYMKSGGKPLATQERNNHKQFIKWMKRWSRFGGPDLTGRNSAGERIAIAFADVCMVVNLSIVSHDSDIRFHGQSAFGEGFSCTIPETALHELARFGGTAIDLLELLQWRAGVSITLPGATIASQIVRWRVTKPDHASEGTDLIRHVLAHIRQTAAAELGSVLADMSASDFLHLSNCCKDAIEATQDQRIWVIAETTGLHVNWFIVGDSLKYGLKGSKHLVQQLATLGLTEQRPIITFGYDTGAFEYRSPLLLALPGPKSPRRSQSELLIRSIARKVGNALPV